MRKKLLLMFLMGVSLQLSAGSLGDEMDEFAIKHRDHFRSLQSEKDPDYNATMRFIEAYLSHQDSVNEEGVKYMKELVRFYSEKKNYELLTKSAKHFIDFIQRHKIVNLSN